MAESKRIKALAHLFRAPSKPKTREEVETEFVRKMVKRLDERREAGEEGITPSEEAMKRGVPKTADELQQEFDDAAKLGPASAMRIGQRFMKETDPEKN